MTTTPRRCSRARSRPRAARIQASIDRAAAEHAADLAQNADFQKALIDIAIGGVERARLNAETVQRAAGVIGTLYGVRCWRSRSV